MKCSTSDNDNDKNGNNYADIPIRVTTISDY